MKRNVLLLAVLAVMLAQPGAIAAGNTFPFPNQMWGLADGVGFSNVALPLQQGWFDGNLAWYVPVIGIPPMSHTLRFQPNLDLDYRYRYPKLTSAIGIGAGQMYIVQNFQQGPVFSSKPGNGDYSGLWQVIYVVWKAGITPRPITSALDLPTAAEADQIMTDIVVDRPIVAIGPLGGPWNPEPPGSYRLKQVIAYNPADKTILLPYWFVYGQDLTTRQPLIAVVLVTDVADLGLAETLKANYAPALALVDAGNTQRFWVQDWTIQPPPPPLQLPIVEWSDNFIFDVVTKAITLKRNALFTPVMDLTLLTRTNLPAYVVVNNPIFLQRLLPPAGNGFLPSINPVRINAPMLISEDLKLFF